jgi:hypothetical protein
MDTDQRLSRYQELLNISEEKALEFFEEQRKLDERFASIIELHSALSKPFKMRSENSNQK